MQEYKMYNADILVKEDCTADDFIDVIEGNRRYIKCLYVYNKIDSVSIEDVDEIARRYSEPYNLNSKTWFLCHQLPHELKHGLSLGADLGKIGFGQSLY
jgi:uncharacterized protein